MSKSCNLNLITEEREIITKLPLQFSFFHGLGNFMLCLYNIQHYTLKNHNSKTIILKCLATREDYLREHIPVTHDNYLKSIFSSWPTKLLGTLSNRHLGTFSTESFHSDGDVGGRRRLRRGRRCSRQNVNL